MWLRSLSLVVILSLSLCTADASQCQAAALIDSPFIQASVLATDHFVFLKSKSGLGLGPEVFNCTGSGLVWRVLETVGDDLAATCHEQRIFNPALLNITSHRRLCNPETFEANPWLCLPGDWTGKFGKVLISPFSRSSKAQVNLVPFFGSNKDDSPADNTLSELFAPEDFRVYEDPLPIPACLLSNLAISFNCEDGRIAGCSFFRPLLPPSTSFSRAQIYEAGMKFLLYADRKGMTGGSRNDRNDNDRSWTDKFRSTDYWNHLWDDVKKKSRNFWDL